VITADDVEALLFDVLGTVVDEAGSMRAELAPHWTRPGAGRQAEALAAAWARRFAALVSFGCSSSVIRARSAVSMRASSPAGPAQARPVSAR
jgi:hypothetical protein